jgi:hypothetical protein
LKQSLKLKTEEKPSLKRSQSIDVVSDASKDDKPNPLSKIKVKVSCSVEPNIFLETSVEGSMIVKNFKLILVDGMFKEKMEKIPSENLQMGIVNPEIQDYIVWLSDEKSVSDNEVGEGVKTQKTFLTHFTDVSDSCKQDRI